MGPEGAIAALEHQVRFGFASYRGVAETATEDDPACAEIASVPYGLGNHAAIQTVYDGLADERAAPGFSWQTPTGHAIRRATEGLLTEMPEPSGAKDILLLTDGNPDTCLVSAPQCGQDQVIHAVQEARAQGVLTLAIGVGELVSAPNTGCNPQDARCGSAHLQDVANAGLGLPVQAPPASYIYQSCVSRSGGELLATYAPSVSEDAPFFVADTMPALRAAIRSLLDGVLSCRVELDVGLEDDPADARVELDGEPVAHDDPDGWSLEADAVSLVLHGDACLAFQEGAALEVGFPCPGDP